MTEKSTEIAPKLSRLAAILSLSKIVYFIILLLVLIYILFFAQDRFVSTGEFRISQQESSAADAGLLGLALPGFSDSRSLDSQVTISFIKSADLLMELEEKFDLKAHFSSPEDDFFFRLSKEAELEDRLEYYRSRIAAHYDNESGITIISVESFCPKFSKEVATYLLEKSENFVNKIDQDIADQQQEFLNKEAERASKNLVEANGRLIKLQNKYKFISPDHMITSTEGIIHELRIKVLNGEAEMATLLRDSPDSPRLDLIRSQIRSLNDLILKEEVKLSGPEKDRLNALLIEFNEVQKELEFRARLLAGTELMLEKNRNDAISNTRFFTVIQNPFLPELATEPRRVYSSITIGVLGILLFLILRAIAHSIFERGWWESPTPGSQSLSDLHHGLSLRSTHSCSYFSEEVFPDDKLADLAIYLATIRESLQKRGRGNPFPEAVRSSAFREAEPIPAA